MEQDCLQRMRAPSWWRDTGHRCNETIFQQPPQRDHQHLSPVILVLKVQPEIPSLSAPCLLPSHLCTLFSPFPPVTPLQLLQEMQSLQSLQLLHDVQLSQRSPGIEVLGHVSAFGVARMEAGWGKVNSQLVQDVQSLQSVQLTQLWLPFESDMVRFYGFDRL